MKTQFLERQFEYNGSQLHSLYAYLEHKILGDSIVAWIGPCDVALDHMVDGEDVLAGSEIRGAQMVHFIAEKFGAGLSEMVALQRLMASLVCDYIRSRAVVAGGEVLSVRRDGDDVWVKSKNGEGKFSISIATVSPSSALMHFAVNVTNRGTPVATASLEDLSIDPKVFACDLLSQFSSECESILDATMKVRWVR